MKKLLLFTSVLCGGYINAQVCFTPYSDFPVDTNSQAIATADFNGDLILDLALANASSNNVSILLGNGAGGFGSATNFSVAASPSSICSADFNGDGAKDLAIACSNQASVILGTGTGSFGIVSNYTIGTQSSQGHVITTDFNNDGNFDLAIAFGNGISVLIGSGTGSFGTPNIIPGTISAMINADFNGDAIQDLAAVNTGLNNVLILLGTGTGSFGNATGYSIPAYSPPYGLYSITGADLNLDGNIDLTVVSLDPVNTSVFNASVLLGSAGGTFGSPINYLIGGPYPSDMTNADFNGDGFIDLAFSYGAAPQCKVMLGTGTGAFGAATSYPTGTNSSPNAVITGDFNGDFKTDIAMASFQNPQGAIILLNCGMMGINNISAQQEIAIAPNPTSSQFFIETNAADQITIDLYEVNGRHVLRTIVNDKSNVNVATLDEGIYIMKIKTSGRIINKKLVILR